MNPPLPPQCADMTLACRWTFWNVDGSQPFMYILMAIAFSIFVGRLFMRIQVWRQGQGDLTLDHLAERTGRVMKYVFGQWKILKSRLPGIMHLAIFAGFGIFFIGTLLADVDQDVTLPL